ncbi:hypothetical protein ACJX0J_014316, partial [Zea mays]
CLIVCKTKLATLHNMHGAVVQRRAFLLGFLFLVQISAAQVTRIRVMEIIAAEE